MRNGKLELRVRGVNRAHAYALQLRPKLLDVFRPFVGTKIEKVDGGLTQKAKAAADALDMPSTPELHVYQYRSGYSLAFCVKTCESDGVSGCYYHEVTLHLGTIRNGVLVELDEKPFNLRTDYTADEVEVHRETYRELKKRADEALSALYPFGEYDR